MSHEVVTVGGGTGSPVVNEALLRTNLVTDIDAIVAMYDNGGATERRRLDSAGKEPAYSDAIRNMLSLVHPDDQLTSSFQLVSRFFKYRDNRDRVPSQQFMHTLFDKQLGFARTEWLLEKFGIRFMGRVLPSSTESSHIAFLTKFPRRYRGENRLDELRMSADTVVDMYLDPSVKAYGPAANAIEKAQLIILSCGSPHGSVFSNFLPDGMKEALSRSRAKMFLVTNLVSTRNETHLYKPMDFVKLTQRYTGRRPDGLIVPEISRKKFEGLYPDVTMMYKLERSHFLGWEDTVLHAAEMNGVQIITHRATRVVESEPNSPVIRHDPQKLSEALRDILTVQG